MSLPVHDFTGSGLEETAAYAQGQADGVLLGHCGDRRISVKEKQEGNAEYGAAEAGLNDVRGQGKADDSAGNRAGRSDERNGQRKPQAREVAAQKAGAGGQGAREGHHESGAPYEVEMKRKEACHKRNKENASAHAGHDGDNAEHETEHEEASGPEPPRVTVCLIRGTGICRGSLGGLNAVLRLPCGCGDRGQSAGRSRLTLHHLSRGLTVFDDSDYTDLPAYRDNVRLRGEWNGANNGRLIGDLCIHGEYTSNPKIVEAVAQHARETGARIQIHLSETQTEHEECKGRHGLTPAAYMEKHGIFDSPTTAAHCVWLEDEAFDILKRHGVTVACCPASNLKLASGYANVPKMLESGINVALGTDGAASNNNLNIMQDMYLFGVVYKGFYHDSTLLTPAQVLHTATRAGALSQGRTDCGKLAVGYKADLCVIDTDMPQFTPMTDAACNVVYAAQGADVRLTMVDGEVLYRDGEFKTIDIEKVKAETQKRTDAILRRL